MSVINEVVEGNNVVLPDYTGIDFSEEAIARGSHRNFVGGVDWRWEHGGLAQLEFLKKQGLRPEHKIVDIGCGSLRAGRQLVDYLNPGNYYGVDANRSLIQAGYDVELTDEQRTRLPSTNLRANDRFNVDFGVQFDFAIAQSVFTHVSLNHMRLCLYRLGQVMTPGGVFFASFVEQPEGTPVDHIFKRFDKGRTYFNEKNVFWYSHSDMRWAISDGPWKFKFVGDYGSSDRQVMAAYTRLSEDEASRLRARAQFVERAVHATEPAELRRRARRVAGRAKRKLRRALKH